MVTLFCHPIRSISSSSNRSPDGDNMKNEVAGQNGAGSCAMPHSIFHQRQAVEKKLVVERTKARFDVCQAGCGESKLDRMSRKEQKRNSDVYKIEC